MDRGRAGVTADADRSVHRARRPELYLMALPARGDGRSGACVNHSEQITSTRDVSVLSVVTSCQVASAWIVQGSWDLSPVTVDRGRHAA